MITEEAANLNRIRLLMESVEKSLREAARLRDSLKKRWINYAYADARRAQAFWGDGRVSGMTDVLAGLVEVNQRLASAASSTLANQRAELADVAHKRLVGALGALKQYLAARQQTEVAA